jgi:ATP-dependent helicase/nuclease subunit A
MEPPHTQNDSLTPPQRRAVAARGNVLVMAGAGTGKTRTLVERCLDCLDRERASLDELLIVTFTEAAAAEMKQRLRHALADTLDSRPSTLDPHLAAQLALFDAAHLGTLHSFCLKLVREHFYELGLDPQPVMLDEGEARLLANETLEEEMQIHYAAENEMAEAVQKLIKIYGGGRDEKIRSLVLRLHHYTQTRPDAEGWQARQLEKFLPAEPPEWGTWLLDAIRDWRCEWLPALKKLRAGNRKAAECLEILEKLPKKFSRPQAAAVLNHIQAAEGEWPLGKKTVLRMPLEDFFADAAFFAALAPVENGRDPLAEDWHWVHGHMATLLRLARNFSARFAARKRDDGVLDFHDLEQFALKLLWNLATDQPSLVAERWRKKIRFVFVDEYQDINAAQDKIIEALSRKGSHANRFLVGDVKQSIYRFRLADPKIFRDYAAAWHGRNGQTIPLAENFRSRESLLHLVNSVFGFLMREEIGGVRYDPEAQLKFGPPETRAAPGPAGDSTPRAELLLHFKKNGRDGPNSENEPGVNNPAELEETEKEARLLAQRLKELKNARHEIQDAKQKAFRPVEWRDMAVLLRSPANKAEGYAKEFERAGVPLVIERGGFFESPEILDLLSLLQLLDNPLQDVPCIAVLRSPLAGLSLDELGEIRLVAKDVHFWTALNRVQRSKAKGQESMAEKIAAFLERFSRWRKAAKQISLSQCLEVILAETHFAEWLRSRPRGAQRQANIERFLNLAGRFDQFRRQGLYRFLKFIEAQREAGVEPEVADSADENAVRLMSIHQSKGLEFPVVAVADLAKPFNTQDLRAEIILDEQFGLCPRVKPPHTGRRYPSLPHWLARRREHRELWGEELRLLYVAMTRARDTLILSSAVTERKWQTLWTKPDTVTPREILAEKCCADWLGLWFAQHAKNANAGTIGGELPYLRWQIIGDDEPAEECDEPVLAENRPGSRGRLPHQLNTLDQRTKQKLRTALSWKYGFNAATKQAAKSSVTALRRLAAEESDDEAGPMFAPRQFTRATGQAPGKLSATETGSAHHKFLQHLALENANDVAALKSEAARLKREKVLSADECPALDLEAVAAFWQSDPGRRIRANAADVRRELAFTAKFSPRELAEIIGTKPELGLENEFVVVQGVADLVVLLPEEIWLVDFKTDEVRVDELPSKIKLYTPQLKLYARALAGIYSRAVTACWLHFLSQNRSVLIG